MSINANALEALKRRRTRIAWIKVWYLGLRRDLFRAKKSAANVGWWGDLQERWPLEEWRLERTSNRTREE